MKKLAVAGFFLCALAVCAFIVHADEDTYVVNTNWTITDPETGAGFFNPGVGVDPDPGRIDYIPQYNDYDWMNTDDLGVTQSELQALLLSWESYCQPAIDGVDVLNSIDDLQEGINRIQIVANHVVFENLLPMKSMFTLTFPPYYTIDEGNRYPMVINGLGYGSKGLNRSVFDGIPMGLKGVKEIYHFDENNRGLVYVRWNVGGYRCMGVNDEARAAINAVIQQLHDDYGCDKHKLITFGGSRAAFAALTTAQNTAHQTYDYTVIGVFAKISPMSIGTVSEDPLGTLPAFASTYITNVGPGASFYTFDPPPGMNPEVLIPAFGPEASNALMPDKADGLSPDHPDNLLALRNKFIWMSFSTHDCYFPFIHFIEMDDFLSDNNIDHTTFISVQGGHSSHAGSIAYNTFKDFTAYLVNDENFDPAEYSPPDWNHGLYENGRNYLLDTDLSDHGSKLVAVDLGELPFSLTIPTRLGCNVFGDGTPNVANEPGVLYLSGAENKSWEISVRRREPGGTLGPVHTWNGTFDSSGTDIIKWWNGRTGWDPFPVYATGTGGVLHANNDWLEWTVTYDGIEYSDFTNYAVDGVRMTLQTEVMADQAYPEELYANYLLGERQSTAFGVDSIPAQPWAELVCTPTSGTAPVEITCGIRTGCYAPVHRTLAYNVDVTLADGTVQPDYWQATVNIGPDESLDDPRVYSFYDESCLGINTFTITVEDVTPSPYNQPPYPPSGLTGSTSRIVKISAPLSDLVRQDRWKLDGNPGWTTEGGWALGTPLGAGGGSGGPDPASGYTGSNTYGYNLAGDYSNNLAAEHLTSEVLDCSGRSNVSLKFWRWLGVEHPDHDHASVQVSNNGVSWATVWTNDTEIADTSWVLMELDISGVADDQSTVYVRWTMGPTDGAGTYCGWNIDDIELWANQTMAPTILAGVSCVPASGAVPFATHMRYTVNNVCDYHRTVATRVDADLASGRHISNWKSGHDNMSPQETSVTEWNQTIPALGFVIGDNLFSFNSRDVTPSPYNQPPNAPSGSTDGDVCTVTGLVP